MVQQQSASVETLEAITDAFNAHDLDAIMEFFADDCSLDMPRGPEPWGRRFMGKAAVREALATRFEGLPDVHYGDDRLWKYGRIRVDADRNEGRWGPGSGTWMRPLGVSRREGDPEGFVLEDRREASMRRLQVSGKLNTCCLCSSWLHSLQIAALGMGYECEDAYGATGTAG